MRFGWLSLFAVLLCAFGCAPRAKLLVLRPAQLDVAGIGRIAVVDFQGQQGVGPAARSVLLAQLAENRHYTLVDQAELARIQPAAFSQHTTDEGAAIEAARQAGVDAVLTGQVVSYDVDDQVKQDHHVSIAGGGAANTSGDKAGGFGIGIDTNTLHSRDASVSLAFKLIDARTGQVRDAHQVSHSYEGRVVNGQGDMPGRERILNDLLRQCSRDVVRAIAPHQEQVEVTLARKYIGKGVADFRRGNKLAVQGDWAGAEEAWQASLKKNPQNHAAHHNLALACEARGDFAAARRHVSNAIRLYGAAMYHQSRQRIDAERLDHEAALAQVNSRPRILPPPNALVPSFPPGMQPGTPGGVIPAGLAIPSSGLQRLPPPDAAER